MAAEMSPNAQMRAQISRWLGRRIDQTAYRVGNDMSVRLGETIGLFEADVLVWRPINERGFIPLANAVLAVEVADTSLRTDLRLKAPHYRAAGVATLWVVDRIGGVTHVFEGGEEAKLVPFETALTARGLGVDGPVLAALED